MGIGNLDRAVTADDDDKLITPHGDWQLRLRSAATSPAAPHYPSWGLATPVCVDDVNDDGDSLPLMGIGNAVRHAVAGPHVLLITPHGDWQRFFPRGKIMP